VPLGFSAGEAGPVCQFRFVTAKDAVGVTVLLPEAETVTLTVPPVTTVPDQELTLLLPVIVTVLLLESVNFQLENVAPEGALFTVQVVLLPRVIDDGEQERAATLSLGLPGPNMESGQLRRISLSGAGPGGRSR